MGIFNFFEKRKRIAKAKIRLSELEEIWKNKYPKGFISDNTKYIECEDGKSRLVVPTDWGIVNCCRTSVERDNCNCEIIKVENISFKGQSETYIQPLTGILKLKHLPYSKEIRKFMMFNDSGKILNTNEILNLWESAKKKEKEYKDLADEIDKLKVILGQKQPKTRIRFNPKQPSERNLQFINDSCFDEYGNPFSGTIDKVKYLNGERIKSSKKEIDKENRQKLIDKEREVLKHEIMTKGQFMFENSNGDYIEVFGQRHTLFLEYQSWDDKYNDWVEGDREEVDSFHLTEYEDGYSFCEDELCKFFNLDEWPEWDYNGVSFDWCGIEEEDDNDERKKKWNEYKNQFPKIDSIKKFNIKN